MSIDIVTSATADLRLEAARGFLASSPPSAERLVVGATRAAADDLAREVAAGSGAAFGLHAFSLMQLVSRLAAASLADRGLAPATGLGAEAVASRTVFEARAAGALTYLEPIADCAGLARAVAATIEELRLANVPAERLRDLGDPAGDIASILQGFDDQLGRARLVDRAGLIREATRAVEQSTAGRLPGLPAVLLDVAVDTPAVRDLVAALARASGRLLATVPAGDSRTLAALDSIPGARRHKPLERPADGSLSRLQLYLFEDRDPPLAEADDEVRFLSAPGEGRETVEIARCLLDEARRGVPFDRMAVLLRSPEQYWGLLETALGRAGVPVHFARGTRRPHPAGRAFLAVLACRAERYSARRFAEYLSLGQVPPLDPNGAPRDRPRWVAPGDEAFGSAATTDEDSGAEVPRDEERVGRAEALRQEGGDAGHAPVAQPVRTAHADAEATAESAADEAPVIAGTLRAPWKWERLLVEAAVVGGRHRWARRLAGLGAEIRLKIAALRKDEPESARIAGLERDLATLAHLRRFALPVIDALADLPERASWGDWLDALAGLARLVLVSPDRVLGTLAELAPMEMIGPVGLDEVRDVLSERLTLVAEPSPPRFGRVFVGTPEHARGRAFDVVLVPGLAERLFPQKPREDPFLLDASRQKVDAGLVRQEDRDRRERLRLRLAVGAARQRLYLFYPRLQLAESRPRVPSFYALEVARATTGRVPDFRRIERAAAEAGDARLAWPAPRDPARAIDDLEYDLAVLDPLLHQRARAEGRGRARYLLELNESLARSLRNRWARWGRKWSRFDGLVLAADRAAGVLGAYRLRSRAYSVSALQKFSLCPYQFYLATVCRLEPREGLTAPTEMDPLTRGSLVHRVQADFLRAMRSAGRLPVAEPDLPRATRALDDVLDLVASEFRDDLCPAIDRVWRDEVELIRGDLRGWLQRAVRDQAEWEPIHFEFGFGFAPERGRDPGSLADPVILDAGWRLHGIVDLIERRRAGGTLRVTDHKTGQDRTKGTLIVGGGETLQPVLYGMAIERALGRPVDESRLSFCTAAAGFSERRVALDANARRHGVRVLEIIDRHVERGFLPAAPRPRVCEWCDFRAVCGPGEERRVARKSADALADLTELRQLP